MDEEGDLQNRYDNLFLSFPIVPSPSFHHHHNFDASDRKSWPYLTQLVSLTKAYQIFETFILDGKNWNVKNNSESQLRMIEEKLNDLLSCLQYEKMYGKKYWQKSQRSVQASVVHFYIFLKMFVWILIPTNHNSLLHANSSSKLLIEIVKLQQLVNEIMQLMKPIHQFMFKQEFKEETGLTQDFFHEMLEFFKQMPKINKKSLVSVPKIMNFINICLSLDPQRLAQNQYSQDFTYHSRKDSYNLTQKRISNKSFTLSQQSVRKQSFKFDQRPRLPTIINRKHSINTSLTKQRSQSQQKSRSPSIQRSFTLFEQQRLKRGTSNSIQTTNRDRDSSQLTGRSRLMTSKTNHSKGSKQKDHKKHLQKEDLELERQGKVKIKKKIIPTLKIKTISCQMNLEKGLCKGWGLIREYLNKKIAERKLKKLLIY